MSSTSTPANLSFYESIPAIHTISEITNLVHYRDVPHDWLIALTDVYNSTQAIEKGKYKDVNSIAAASIAALLNAIPADIPFVFGGDGATMLIPPDYAEQAKEVLLATQALAVESFDLRLRAGIVPVQDVLTAGYAIRVTRLQMSENFQQAIFIGGGLSYAERLFKDTRINERYLVQIDENKTYQADFTGFECRWNSMRSPSEETLSLMVMAIEEDMDARNATYQDILNVIESIYGDSQARHPISLKNMRLLLLPHRFKIEAKVRYQDTSFRQLWRLAKATFMGRIGMWFNVGRWGTYKAIMRAAMDNEKFDDTLRMIISGTKQQRKKLRVYLEEKHQQKKLVFGIHTARHALVTCIVYDYFGKQVHFVDGANGGYALAAKEMKAQLAQLQ